MCSSDLPAIPIPASDTSFPTADGRVLNLSVTGVPAQLTGTLTAKAGLSTDGGATMLEVSDFTHTSLAVHSSLDGSVLMLDVTSLTRTGSDNVKHKGTFDAFTVMAALRDLLCNEQGLPDATVRQRASEMLTEIDSAHDAVLDGLREFGFRSSSMQMLGNRVSSLELSRQESLSSLQDTDMTAAILDLQRHDIGYQAALQVSAKMIQTTLQSYLR